MANLQVFLADPEARQQYISGILKILQQTASPGKLELTPVDI
jgi:hypothetical protein